MSPRKEARAVAAAPGAGFEHWRALDAKHTTRRRPPYAKGFRPGRNRDARIIVGWPGCTPPDNSLVLPPDEPPAAFDWTMLRGCCVLIQPAPGCLADHETLRQLAREVARAGAAAALMYDGRQVVGEYWADPDARPQVRP